MKGTTPVCRRAASEVTPGSRSVSVVDTTVKRLRKKLGSMSHAIQTVREAAAQLSRFVVDVYDER